VVSLPLLFMLPEDCEAEEPDGLLLVWPAPLLGLLEVSGDCEDEGVLCATIHAEQANSVRLSKIVFVMV
jgi:hypothetical protein